MSLSHSGSVEQIARAKINLSLHLTGRRGDGYHLLDSIVAFAEIGDRLVVEKAGETSFQISGPFAEGLHAGSPNLVTDALALLKDSEAAVGAMQMQLTKNLPVSSGIGGGSADAAAALRGITELWELGNDLNRLAELGLSLGADVPVCVYSRSCRMAGIGEDIEFLDAMPEIPAVLVNPGTAVSTARIFSELGVEKGTLANEPLSKPPESGELTAWLDYLLNSRSDLQEPAISIAPVIDEVLEALSQTREVELVRMSGSGATCFGLYRTSDAAKTAAEKLRQQHPDWWIVSTVLG